MCIQKTTHTLPCDIRPLSTFTDPSKPTINPWAVPPSCACTTYLSSFSRCTHGHKCCAMTVTFLPCDRPEICRSSSPYHVYTRSGTSDPNCIPWESFDVNLPERQVDLSDRVYGSIDEGWAPLPMLDERFMSARTGETVPFVDGVFVAARQTYLDLGVECYRFLRELKELNGQLDVVRRHLADDEHYRVCRLRMWDPRNWSLFLVASWRCEYLDRELPLLGEIFRVGEQIRDVQRRADVWEKVLADLYMEEMAEGWIEGLDAWEGGDNELVRCYGVKVGEVVVSGDGESDGTMDIEVEYVLESDDTYESDEMEFEWESVGSDDGEGRESEWEDEIVYDGDGEDEGNDEDGGEDWMYIY